MFFETIKITVKTTLMSNSVSCATYGSAHKTRLWQSSSRHCSSQIFWVRKWPNIQCLIIPMCLHSWNTAVANLRKGYCLEMDFVLKQMQMIMCDLSANWNSSYHELEQRIISMEQKLDELGRSFQSTSELLTQALHRRRLDHRYTVKNDFSKLYINRLLQYIYKKNYFSLSISKCHV